MTVCEPVAVRSIEVFEVHIPLRHAFVHRLASHKESRPYIVRLLLSNGIVGYGEAQPRTYLSGETGVSVCAALRCELGPFVVGKQMTSLESVVQLLSSAQGKELRERFPAAFCGLELALLDAVGRHSKRPVTDALGEICRHELVYDGAVIGFLPTAPMRLYLRAAKKQNKQLLKIKVGRPDDIERVAAAREIVGDEVELVLDANGAWSAKEAINHIRALEQFRITAIEQPVSRHDIQGMAAVRRSVEPLIMADESLCTVADAGRLLEEEACDAWNIRIAKCGGLLGALELARLAEQNGILCQLGVLVGETGILGAAGRHLASCFRFSHLEFDSSGIKSRDVLLEPLLPIVNNVAQRPPPDPGLGIEVDAEFLQHFTIAQEPNASRTGATCL